MGDGLAGVQRAAAAEADDEVTLFLLGDLHAALNRLYLRLAWHCEQQRTHPILVKKGCELFGAAGVAAGDDQCAPAKFLCQYSNFAQRARAENDSCGGGKFEAHVY